MRSALVLILLVFGFNAFADSGQTPTLNQNASQKKTHTANNNQPTYKYAYESPLKVTISPPPKDDPERKEYDSGQARKTNIELGTLAIAIVTAIILLFQAIAFFIQARRLSQTVEATEKAVKSSQDSERPYIFVEVGPSSIELCTGFNVWCAKYIIKNQGKTPAIITGVWGDVCYKKGGPPSAKKTASGHYPRGGVVIEAGGQRTFPAIAAPLKGNDAEVFCYGRIDYRDIFGIDHYTSFCWYFQHDEEGGSFQPFNDNDLNDYT